MSRTMAVVVAVLVSILAAGGTGVASYATGQARYIGNLERIW